MAATKELAGVSRARTFPFAAPWAWGTWFFANGLAYWQYVDRGHVALMPSAAFWAMVLIAPVAFYRDRDESIVAIAAMLVVTIALMLR